MTTDTMHATTVTGAGRGFLASCPCGWSDGNYSAAAAADASARRHRAEQAADSDLVDAARRGDLFAGARAKWAREDS